MTFKPRNPLVADAKFRRAGAHDKPHKAKRRAEKTDLARTLRLDRPVRHDRVKGFASVRVAVR